MVARVLSVVLIVLGIGLIVRTIAGGVGGGLGFVLGALLSSPGSCGCTFRRRELARKLPGLQRVLATPSLAAVAYGEIAVVALLRARHRGA